MYWNKKKNMSSFNFPRLSMYSSEYLSVKSLKRSRDILQLKSQLWQFLVETGSFDHAANNMIKPMTNWLCPHLDFIYGWLN